MAKLRHIALSVDDVDKTAEFYKAAFGLEEKDRSKTRVWLSDGVVSLAIIDVKNHRNAGVGPQGLNHFGFSADDLEETVQLVLEHGGSHHDQARSEDHGSGRSVKFKDPDGVYVEVVSEKYAEAEWYA